MHEFSLPKLSGTEKQVQWAESLREGLIYKLLKLRSDWDIKIFTIEQAIQEIVNSNTSSSFYINNKDISDYNVKKLLNNVTSKMFEVN